MAGRTENTSPIVTQAAPTDTNTEEISSEKTVQSAQAPAAVQVASPGRGGGVLHRRGDGHDLPARGPGSALYPG